jgi:RNA polymerase sigma-70 factor, ECF subfamily
MIDHLFRRQAGRMVAHLAASLGPAYLDLAEEAVQDAMLRALGSWPQQGVPDNPAAWLFRVAHNAAIDTLRRKRVFGAKTEDIVADLDRRSSGPRAQAGMEEQLQDEELRMIFMCCHPAISRDASVALSLKIIGGFSIREIARAFFEPETTTAQRIVRAKRHIRERGLSLEMPTGGELAERIDAVLEVLYLMFNEGYAAHEGEQLIRQDLCMEALRLGQLLASSSISLPRVHALVALMAFQAARCQERVGASGDLILLEDQDRSRWDRGLISLGFNHFDRSIAGDELSTYHVQAAIAATHARAHEASATNWGLILSLYDQLLAIHPSAVVALNRVVAISKVQGPGHALAELKALNAGAPFENYYLYCAVRGHLLFDTGRRTDAAIWFQRASELPCSEPERRFLRAKLAECHRM